MNYPKVGIGVLIFNKEYLLLGQRQSIHGRSTWGPPGGHLEFGETFAACAIRETKEETDLVIRDPKVVAITNDVFKEENKHYVSIFVNACFPTEQKIVNNEPDKITTWEWFDIRLLPDSLFLPLKNLLRSRGEDFLLRIAQAQRCS